MSDKTFEKYQKRMLDAMQNPNQHSNAPFTKLSNKLDNLKKFVNCRTFSKAEFKQEVNKLFNSSDEETIHIKNMLMSFSSTKKEAIKTISELQSMIKPISAQIGSLSAVADIANEYMAEIEKQIFK